jgi:NAD(P)-dependent dehydrogenase (short-subunit alcohol dehydrogenase family)
MSVVLITGAAEGLGRATAVKFHDQGWTVIAIDINPTVNDLHKKGIHTFVADVTSEQALSQVAGEVHKKGLKVSVIINNAGIFEFLPITQADFNALQRIFMLNSLAPFLVIKTFLNDLSSTKGRVIQISSENVKLNGLFQPYPSAKIALEALSEGARQELKLLGVSLSIVRPGAIQTNLLNWKKPVSTVYQKYIERLITQARARMSRVVSPDEVAELVLKVAKSGKPRHIYSINHNLWLAIFSKLPRRIRDRIVQSMITNDS